MVLALTLLLSAFALFKVVTLGKNLLTSCLNVICNLCITLQVIVVDVQESWIWVLLESLFVTLRLRRTGISKYMENLKKEIYICVGYTYIVYINPPFYSKYANLDDENVNASLLSYCRHFEPDCVNELVFAIQVFSFPVRHVSMRVIEENLGNGSYNVCLPKKDNRNWIVR